jgi:hypothetical protein
MNTEEEASVEIFADFGLFELLAAGGLAVMARKIYSKKAVGVAFLLMSVAAPAATIVASSTSLQRGIALTSLVTCLVNGSVVLAVLQAGRVPTLKLPARFRPTRQGRDDVVAAHQTDGPYADPGAGTPAPQR